jgi:hypothetical protein
MTGFKLTLLLCVQNDFDAINCLASLHSGISEGTLMYAIALNDTILSISGTVDD